MCTYSPPPEWADQERLLIGWPSHYKPWGVPFDAARAEIATFANTILTKSPTNGCGPTRVSLVLDGQAAEYAAREAVPDADIINTACGDVWLRDTGPIFSRQDGRLLARRFRFNGWGEKYNYPGDADLAGRLASYYGSETKEYSFVLEGGSLDWDGAGHVLTTRDCLLNPNRNPRWSEKDAEASLTSALGFSEVIWLEKGLLNDHTDGHIDNLARFVGPRHVICQTPNGNNDPQADVLLSIRNELLRWRNKQGEGLKVSTLPSPGRVLDSDGEIMPASHMNFVITNQCVIIPAYNDQAKSAVQALQPLFPDREVIGLPAKAVLTGGGAFHCISQQIPAVGGGQNE